MKLLPFLLLVATSASASQIVLPGGVVQGPARTGTGVAVTTGSYAGMYAGTSGTANSALALGGSNGATAATVSGTTVDFKGPTTLNGTYLPWFISTSIPGTTFISTLGSYSLGGTPNLSATSNNLATSAQLTGSNVLYVAIGGNNSTAVRGDMSHPYLTIDSAIAASGTGDVIQIGPGLFASPTTTPNNQTWFNGNGAPDYLSDNSAMIGGTRLYGTWAILTSGTLTGLTFSNFGVDNGATNTSVLLGGTAQDCFSVTGFVGGNPTPDTIVRPRISNVRVLGSAAANAKHGFSLQSCIYGTFENVEARYCGHGFVEKNRYCNANGIIARSCGIDGIVLKSNSPTLYAQHLNLSNVIVTGTETPIGILLNDPVLSNTAAPLQDISITNVQTADCATGIEVLQQGNAALTGINISNVNCERGGAAFSAIYVTGTGQVSANLSNVTARNTTSYAFDLSGVFNLSNCVAEGCVGGYKLSNAVGLSRFSNCRAVNPGVGILLATASGVYVTNEPIRLTGTYGTLISTNGTQFSTLPMVYRALSATASVGNSTAEATLIRPVYAHGSLIIPQALCGKPIRVRMGGAYVVTGTGATCTFRVKLGGATQATQVFTPSGTDTSFIIDAVLQAQYDNLSFTGTYPTGFIVPEQFMMMDGVYKGTGDTGLQSFNFTQDNAIDVTAQWSVASASNIAYMRFITVEIINDSTTENY